MSRPVSAASKSIELFAKILASRGDIGGIELYRFALEWAILVVDSGQTPDEHEMKETIYQNKVGWRHCHRKSGPYMADWIRNGTKSYGRKPGQCLSGTWVDKAAKAAKCYWRQWGPTCPQMLASFARIYGIERAQQAETAFLALPAPKFDDDEPETVEVTPEKFQMPPSSREIVCGNCGSVAMVRYARECNECGERYLASLQYVRLYICSNIESTTLVVWA